MRVDVPEVWRAPDVFGPLAARNLHLTTAFTASQSDPLDRHAQTAMTRMSAYIGPYLPHLAFRFLHTHLVLRAVPVPGAPIDLFSICRFPSCVTCRLVLKNVASCM